MGVTHIAYTTSSGGGRGTSFIAQTFLELGSTKVDLVTRHVEGHSTKEDLTRAST
jgi:hypothetical protein